MNSNPLIAILCTLLIILTCILGFVSMCLWQETLEKREIYHMLMHAIDKRCVNNPTVQPPLKIVPPQIRIIPKTKPKASPPQMYLEVVDRG